MMELVAVDLAAEADNEPVEEVLAEVEGRTIRDGLPFAGATVMFYDGAKKKLVGPGFVKMTTSGEDGIFRISIPPGSYAISVRKRLRGTGFGPPAPGDLVGEFADNPLQVGEGVSDLGDVPLHVIDMEKLGQRLGSLDRPPPGATTLSGRVVDDTGKPLGTRFVFLYRNAELTGRPLYVTRSGQDGRFLLNVPAGGLYYVIARDRYGVQRQLGDYIGFLADHEDSAIEVLEGGRIEDLVIRMEQR